MSERFFVPVKYLGWGGPAKSQRAFFFFTLSVPVHILGLEGVVALYTWGFIRARSLGGNVLPGGKLGGGSLSNTVFLVLHGKKKDQMK